MKSLFKYIIIVFVLCFGFKTQAQTSIEEFKYKKSNLSSKESQELDFLINGGEGYMFITKDKQVISFPGKDGITRLDINSSNDFTELTKGFTANMTSVIAINIQWDGNEEIVLEEQFLQKISDLKYIYIRSYTDLSKDLIQQKFYKLLEQLNKHKNVIVLYETMEQPS